MPSRHLTPVLLSALATLSGCVSTEQATQKAQSSPLVNEELPLISAGHTGCMPADIAISIVWVKPNYTALWKATCKGKTYLCSSAENISGSTTASCAPEAQ
jgi:hypothetical protein